MGKQRQMKIMKRLIKIKIFSKTARKITKEFNLDIKKESIYERYGKAFWNLTKESCCNRRNFLKTIQSSKSKTWNAIKINYKIKIDVIPPFYWTRQRSYSHYNIAGKTKVMQQLRNLWNHIAKTVTFCISWPQGVSRVNKNKKNKIITKLFQKWKERHPLQKLWKRL